MGYGRLYAVFGKRLDQILRRFCQFLPVVCGAAVFRRNKQSDGGIFIILFVGFVCGGFLRRFHLLREFVAFRFNFFGAGEFLLFLFKRIRLHNFTEAFLALFGIRRCIRDVTFFRKFQKIV